MITAFQALFHTQDPIYYPEKFRVLVGFIPNEYHYVSPLFKFEDNAKDQYFSLLPDVVIGKYVKIEFYGKPQIQDMDDKYYIALQKVSCQGIPIDSPNIPALIKPTLSSLSENTLKSEVLRLGLSDKAEFMLSDPSENMTDEEVEFVEDSLLKLSKGEIKLVEFMEEHNISDFLDWITTKRLALLKNDKIYKNLDSLKDMSETFSFFKRKNVVDSKTGLVSLCKVILCFLYSEYAKYTVMDKVNTEIFFKILMAFINDFDNFKLILRVGIHSGMKFNRSQDLYDKYFQRAEGGEDVEENNLKFKALRALDLHQQELIFRCSYSEVVEKEMMFYLLQSCDEELGRTSHFNSDAFCDSFMYILDKKPQEFRENIKKIAERVKGNDELPDKLVELMDKINDRIAHKYGIV